MLHARQGAEVTAHLEGSWAATPAAAGDAVSLVAEVRVCVALEFCVKDNMLVLSFHGLHKSIKLGASLQVYEHDGAAHAVLDDRAGLLVLHPDLLLSGACTCSGALQGCRRTGSRITAHISCKSTMVHATNGANPLSAH